MIWAGRTFCWRVSLEESGRPRSTGSQRLQAADLVRTEVLRLTPAPCCASSRTDSPWRCPDARRRPHREALELAERLRERLAGLLTGGHVTDRGRAAPSGHRRAGALLP